MRNLLLSCFSALLLMACNGSQDPSAEQSRAESAGADVAATTQAEAVSVAPSACELNVGWNPYEPYQYADLDGNVRGLDLDLVSALAKQAGCSLRFTQDEWSKLLKGVQTGNIDVLTGATQTVEREKYAHFSKPYRDETFVIFVRTGESEKWLASSIEEMVRDKKMRIGLVDGYVYGNEVDHLLGNADYMNLFISAPFSESHAANLLDSKIDGLLEDPFVGASMVKRKALGERLTKLNFILNRGQVSLMFSKASVTPEQIGKFDSAIDAIKANGEFDAIIKRYRK